MTAAEGGPAGPRLVIDLVPQPLWGKSLYRTLPRSQWRRLRQWAVDRSENRCEACGQQADRLIGHELWAHDDGHGVQTLTGVQVHWPACDAVAHIGRISVVLGPAGEAEAMAWLARVNRVDAGAGCGAPPGGGPAMGRARRAELDARPHLYETWYERWKIEH
jgi:hypothetical protein